MFTRVLAIRQGFASLHIFCLWRRVKLKGKTETKLKNRILSHLVDILLQSNRNMELEHF